MATLSAKLIESRSITDTTALEYINQLKQLNGGVPYSNLGFLKRKEEMMSKIHEYAESTQKSILGALVSILSLMKDKPTYKATYNFYYERMKEMSKKARDIDTSVKTDKQEANWLTWENVVEHYNALAAKVDEFKNSKVLTPGNWNTLLSWAVLALYTLIPPRRNQDYQSLYIVKTDKNLEDDKNYYVIDKKEFVFNKYKTSKSHGKQVVDGTPLADVMKVYLKFHPNSRLSKGGEVRFLVNSDGSALTSVNSITRILNKIFGKQVGSSMLRHIYLSSKYKNQVQEMTEDAEAMGHTVATQREYVKK